MPRRLVIALLASALVATGCGGGDDDASPSRSSVGYPVAVRHALGTTTVPGPAKRVVALDPPSADALLALGIKPVGMPRAPYDPSGLTDWTRAALERLPGPTPKLLGPEGNGYPYERIAAARPDLIVGTAAYPPLKGGVYDKLRAIAPTVAQARNAGTDPWQDGVRLIAEATGREDEGGALIERVEGQVRRTRAAHPEFRGRTVTVFNAVALGSVYLIDSDEDASIRFLTDLGFAGVPPGVARTSKGNWQRTLLSPERYDLLDAGLVLGASAYPQVTRQLSRDPSFARVPAVAAGHYRAVPLGDLVSIAFPSVLSVPWALRELTPTLASAV